jgi:hypothetical protein
MVRRHRVEGNARPCRHLVRREIRAGGRATAESVVHHGLPSKQDCEGSVQETQCVIPELVLVSG